MKALSFIGLALAAFLIWVGVTSRSASGAVLGNAVIAGGVIIIGFLVFVQVMLFFKNRQEK